MDLVVVLVRAATKVNGIESESVAARPLIWKETTLEVTPLKN